MPLKSLKTALKWIAVFQLIILILSGLISGCASIKQPTGGPRDSTPPTVVKETPPNLTKNFKAERIQIQLSEFFKLSNEFKEISISPEMEKIPEFKIRKNILEIRLQDTLEENTTYTINFGNAIVDYNEGNVLKNYSYVFATGDVIDSLSISGKVVDALTKQPVLDATAFIIPITRDTIFGKKRASIFTSTDSSGNFSMKHLRENTYRIYAVKEEGGGDKIYNSTNESIAFANDSIVLKGDTANIRLELFKEVPKNYRILDRKIEPDGRILITFNKPLKQPSLKIIEPEALDKAKLVEFSSKGDTVQMWLPEMTFDSLKVVPLDGNTVVDTINFRRGQKDEYKREITIADNLNNNVLKPGTDLVLTFSMPVDALDGSKIKLLEDSVARRAEIIKDTSSLRRYTIKYRWRSEKQYIFSAEEGAFTNSFGGKSVKTERVFTLDSEDNYGNLTLNISLPDTSKNYIVQLLRSEGEIIRRNQIRKNDKIIYNGLPVDKYYIRIIYDLNNNGEWDTGDVEKRRQPEEVWNFEKEIMLRANWDIEEKITVPPLP